MLDSKYKYYTNSYFCCSLKLLLNKINNYESSLINLIVSFYFNILVSDVKYVFKYLPISHRFKKGTNFVDVVKEIKNLLKNKTIIPHNLSEETLINGILKSTLKGRIIDKINARYEYISKYDYETLDFVKNYDFFIIDVTTTKKGKFRIYINPSFEYCYIQDYYIIKSNRYHSTRLSDLYWIFNNRQRHSVKLYSRLNYKHAILKNIQENTIKFFGLSTYYFWDHIEKERILNQNNGTQNYSLC